MLKEIKITNKKKGGVKVTLQITKEDEEALLQYAINELVAKGAASIIKDQQEENIYRLIFEPTQGNA